VCLYDVGHICCLCGIVYLCVCVCVKSNKEVLKHVLCVFECGLNCFVLVML